MADPTPQTTPEDGNSTIKEMRTRIDQLTEQLKSTSATAEQLTAKETELNNLREELTKAQQQLATVTQNPDVEKLTAYETRLSETYEAEILSAPAEKQEALRKLSSSGTILDRIDAVKAAKSLFAADVGVINPVNPPGVIGEPPRQPNPTPVGNPVPAGPFQPPGWGDVLKPANK